MVVVVRIAGKELRAFRFKRTLELNVVFKVPVVKVNGTAQNIGIDRNDLEYLQEYLYGDHGRRLAFELSQDIMDIVQRDRRYAGLDISFLCVGPYLQRIMVEPFALQQNIQQDVRINEYPLLHASPYFRASSVARSSR